AVHHGSGISDRVIGSGKRSLVENLQRDGSRNPARLSEMDSYWHAAVQSFGGENAVGGAVRAQEADLVRHAAAGAWDPEFRCVRNSCHSPADAQDASGRQIAANRPDDYSRDCARPRKTPA